MYLCIMENKEDIFMINFDYENGEIRIEKQKNYNKLDEVYYIFQHVRCYCVESKLAETFLKTQKLAIENLESKRKELNAIKKIFKDGKVS